MSDAPTLIDLFSGCGGLTQGFVDAGFRPVKAVEWEVAAAATYAENFGDIVHIGDIADLKTDEVPPADVVVGGPPCQGFSGLGLRDPNDARNGLWRHYLRVVEAAKPQVFVIENVARFFASPDYKLLEVALKSGVLKEYAIWTGKLDAADYGVPQRRIRAFVIGSRIGRPSKPSPSHHRDSANLAGLAPWVTLRTAFAGIAHEPSSVVLPDRQVQHFGQSIRGAFSGAEIHLGRQYQDTSLRRYDAVPPGGNRFDLPEDLLFQCWKDKRSGTTDVMGRLQWDRPSVTVRTEFFKPEKGRYLHPEYGDESGEGRQNRAITHLEAARIQSFADEFKWCGSKVEIARQIGNAVPPLLARAIAERGVLPLLKRAPGPRTSAPASDDAAEQLDIGVETLGVTPAT